MLETVSLMNRDIEEYEVVYDTETYDIVAWDWKGVEHPFWTMGAPIKFYDTETGKGLMYSYFGARVWEEGYAASRVLLDAFGLEKYNVRDIARKTFGIMRVSSVTLWFWFHDQLKRTWNEVCEQAKNDWDGLDERCIAFVQSQRFMH